MTNNNKTKRIFEKYSFCFSANYSLSLPIIIIYNYE